MPNTLSFWIVTIVMCFLALLKMLWQIACFIAPFAIIWMVVRMTKKKKGER